MKDLFAEHIDPNANDNALAAEWRGMPEFVQDKQEPYKALTIRFADESAYQEFAALIGQRLTIKTKSIWYPELMRGLNARKRYVNE